MGWCQPAFIIKECHFKPFTCIFKEAGCLHYGDILMFPSIVSYEYQKQPHNTDMAEVMFNESNERFEIKIQNKSCLPTIRHFASYRKLLPYNNKNSSVCRPYSGWCH